jgi:hypothetical protein
MASSALSGLMLESVVWRACVLACLTSGCSRRRYRGALRAGRHESYEKYTEGQQPSRGAAEPRPLGQRQSLVKALGFGSRERKSQEWNILGKDLEERL